jgi:hypothetical protein
MTRPYRPRYLSHDTCEEHDGPGSCTDECVHTLYAMDGGPGPGLPYDPTGCRVPPPMPELSYVLDHERRQVVAVWEHPMDCECGECPRCEACGTSATEMSSAARWAGVDPVTAICCEVPL